MCRLGLKWVLTVSVMSSGGFWNLLTIKIQQMTIESTNDNTPTTPAITYSRVLCEAFTLAMRLQQHNKSDLEYLQEWIDLKTSKIR